MSHKMIDFKNLTTFSFSLIRKWKGKVLNKPLFSLSFYFTVPVLRTGSVRVLRSPNWHQHRLVTASIIYLKNNFFLLCADRARLTSSVQSDRPKKDCAGGDASASVTEVVVEVECTGASTITVDTAAQNPKGCESTRSRLYLNTMKYY